MTTFNTIEELKNYLKEGNFDTETLLNALSSSIMMENTMCFLEIFRGNKGWTICYNSNDQKIGTPNITTKDYSINSACIKALEYLIQYNFHHLQNKNRNIFLDMLTVK